MPSVVEKCRYNRSLVNMKHGVIAGIHELIIGNRLRLPRNSTGPLKRYGSHVLTLFVERVMQAFLKCLKREKIPSIQYFLLVKIVCLKT